MLLKTLVYKKKDLITVVETGTLEEALRASEAPGYRHVSILDSSGNIFRGNTCKMHIYRHKANGGGMTLLVIHLLKNATKPIYLDTSLSEVSFMIKGLPYIAVLDSENRLYGTLTYSALLNILPQSWDVEQGNYVLAIVSIGKQGDLVVIAKIISKYSSTASCTTLDIEKDEYIRRILITLPANTEAKVCETIVNHLEKKDYRVAEVESL